ncbi:helix-turn-helix domain-containing protein [Nonomuraea jabiensis]|uniref:helix-turn-helix domain-containing protein n=1 Tax=Nonomuraea jabiensis TaxID=882448 RepID=UPI0034134279
MDTVLTRSNTATRFVGITAFYDRRVALGLSVAELADRAMMTEDEIECIEEGGTAPTVALLRRLAAALEADVRLASGHDLGSVRFEAHAA